MSNHPKTADKLYLSIDPKVKTFKVFLQMLVGAFIFFIITIKAFKISGIYLNHFQIIEYINNNPFLLLVGKALLASSAIELGYMLFTDGPDEAIDPLILSITASALIVLSPQESPKSVLDYYTDSKTLLFFSISLILLFFLRFKVKSWFPRENME